MKVSTLSSRVDELLQMDSEPFALQSALLHGTIGVIQALYGVNSAQEKALSGHVDAIFKRGHPANDDDCRLAVKSIKGVLTSLKGELEAGFVGSLRVSLTGEILADLIKLSRVALDEPGDDSKNVAAVLAAAAFEDVLRKLGEAKVGGEHEKLADVLTALKEAGVFQGAEVGIAQSYLSFRNRALHAKWSEVDRPGIESVLGFTEQIIVKHFT